MSKHFGGGRRLEDKGYPPRRVVEDKRPSVFDRLGVREYDENPSSSHSHSHAHYGSERGSGGGGGSYRRMDGPSSGMRKHSPSPMNSMMGGRRNPDPRDKIRSRSRSRSFSPRSRRVPSDVGHHGPGGSVGGGHGGHNPMKKMKPTRDPRDMSPHDHRMRPRSNSPMRRKMDKPMGSGNNRDHNPNWRDRDNPPPPRHKERPSTSGNVGMGGGDRVKSKKGSGGKQKKKGKSAGGKEKSTSGSSGSSGETSSSSRSASSSSSTSENSSSSTSNATSSSDSSVPSIKLKHDKQSKRKKAKRPSSKSESVSTGQIQSRISSGSSIESGNVRDNRDLREKIKAKNRQNYEKMNDGAPVDPRQQRRQPEPYGGSRNYNKHDMREHTPGDIRRRRSSGAGSYEDTPSKRRRVLSPEEYVPSPRRAPPPNDPPHGPPGRRDRSPLPPQRDRMRPIQSPMRRAPLEDRRVDMGKRLDNYPDNKHRDGDRDRYRDEGPYGRDGNMMRQKDRLAPARPPPMRQPPGPGSGSGQSNQDQRDRDRGTMEREPPGGGGHRFEARHSHSRPPLLLPPGVPPPEREHMKAPYSKPNVEDRVLRTTVLPQQSPGTGPQQAKHSPMIVKSKEALIEKYRGMKQSQYVDMWVDKTVEACGSAPPGNTIVSPPPPAKDTPSDSSKPEATVTSPPPKAPMADIGELLSDFSDDDEELLNEVGDEPKSVKSDKANNTVQDKEKAPAVVAPGECEAEATSSATTEIIAPTENKVAPAVVTPSTHERKSLGTPQRSFSEAGREGHSLPSRSQTEDDILERMDFEEISDEELGDVGGENKIPIVDALGVDWASLVCGEKNSPSSPSSAVHAVSSSSSLKVRKRWTPLQVISRVGVISNCSERLLQSIVQMKMKEDEQLTENAQSGDEDQEELEEKLQDELQNAGKCRKIRARANVIDTIGLGPNSRALSSRRDMALRRYYLGMPQKSLVSMDMLHQNSASSSVQDLDSIGELYRLSLSLFKGSETASAVV